MRKTIRRRIQRSGGGINLAAGLDAVISVNHGADGESSETRSRSEIRIEQGDGTRPDAPRHTTKEPDQEAP